MSGSRDRVSRHALAGVVAAQLPSGLYRVRLDGGGEVLAHAAGRIDRNFIRLLIGDRVRLELSSINAGRGRIVERI